MARIFSLTARTVALMAALLLIAVASAAAAPRPWTSESQAYLR